MVPQTGNRCGLRSHDGASRHVVELTLSCIQARLGMQDLDTALLSRCQSIVTFGLPDEACRAKILEHYAAHLQPKVCADFIPDVAADSVCLCEMVSC